MIETIKSADEFKELVANIESSNNYRKPIAFSREWGRGRF